MQYRQLGNSSLQLSEIGFGCMSLEPDQRSVNELTSIAIDKGINFFDTADLYDKGKNEEMLGIALKQKRKQIILASKVGNQWRNDGNGWDWNASKSYILSAIDKSLQRLQTDYLDLYQLHGGTLEDPMDEILEAFERLQQQGKILFYGISSIRPNVIREYVKRSAISSVMMQYSLLDRRPEEEALPLLRKNSIGILARGSLAKGLLVGKPADSFLNYSAAEVGEAAAAISKIAGAEAQRSSIAARYVLAEPTVSSAIIGIRTKTQLEEAIIAGSAPALSGAGLDLLKTAVAVNYYDVHR